MAVQNTDLIMLERGGTLYNETVANLLANASITVIDNLTSTSTTDPLSANQGRELRLLVEGLGDIRNVADIAARDALIGTTGFNAPAIVHVSDDGDGNWARYQLFSPGTAPTDFVKISDQDALAAGLGATQLGYTASPTGGNVTNTSGTDATLTLADATNAGLQAPADKAKQDFISVTQAVDLDALETASHAEVTTAGSATTNPIVVTGQELSFSISALATAP